MASGAKGITFSGIAGEEGVFQFEPWFWGAGADFSDLASPAAISAGQLLSDWIGKGWAPRSALTDNQSASWDLFLTGEYGFAENGSWFAAAAAATKGFTGGHGRRSPASDGGLAPVPTGGEFAVAPLQSTDASNHYANAAAVIDCLSAATTPPETSETLGYLSAKPDIRATQVASNAAVEAVGRRSSRAPRAARPSSAPTTPAVSGEALRRRCRRALNAAGDANGVATAFKDAAGS